jgi:hypothetical protein
MPRKVPAEQKAYALHLMSLGEMGQREMEKETGLSRPYIRKLAREIGYQFPRNGIENLGQLCMCSNCGIFFRRPPSKIKRTIKQFCDDVCKFAWMKGPQHPAWKTGKTANTFSSWVKNQSEYKDWCQKVLEKYNNKCVVSGRDYDLECHHLEPKAEGMSPEKVFNVDNGIVLNKEVHTRLHQLASEGYTFEAALEKVKEEFKN